MSNIATTGEIREKLKKIIDAKQIFARLCKVKEVDKDNLTCTVTYIDNGDIEIFDVLICPNDSALNYAIPVIGSIVLIDWISPDQAYIAMISEVEQYYQATSEESILDIFLDLMKALKAIQLTTSQGPTAQNGVINLNDFLDIENRLKKFYLQ